MKKLLLLALIGILCVAQGSGIIKNTGITAASLNKVKDSTSIDEATLSKLNEIKDWNDAVWAMIEEMDFYGKYGTSTSGEEIKMDEITNRFKEEITKLSDYDIFMDTLASDSHQKLKFVWGKLSASLHRTSDIILSHTITAYIPLDLDTLDLIQYGAAFQSKVLQLQK